MVIWYPLIVNKMNIRRIIREEMNDFDWAIDTQSNHDIAQNIVDKTNMWMADDDLRVNLPFMTYGEGYSAKQLFKTFSLLRDKNPTIMFLEYLLYKYGIERTDHMANYKINPNAQDIWFRYKNLITKKVLDNLKDKPINESNDFDWIKDRPQPSEGVVKLIIYLPNMFLEYDVDFKNVEQFLSLVQDYAIEAVEGYMMPIDRIGLNGWVVLNRYPSETQELKVGLNKLKKKVNSYL